ncbi:MAG: hypothetical protein ABIR68_00190 [Ilumatobacteraceae bacterium]
MFACTTPGSALFADVDGRSDPVGHTVTKLGTEASSSIVVLSSAPKMHQAGRRGERKLRPGSD